MFERWIFAAGGITAERFVPDRWEGRKGDGYTGRGSGEVEADGEFRVFGAKRSTGKGAGFRIELGEIEGVLSRHEEVAEVSGGGERGSTWGSTVGAYVVEKKSGEE